MAYEFKKLSDVNIIEEMKDGLNVLDEDGGEIVKISANNIIPEDVALKSDIPTDVVKSVNGEVPDENGNVQVSGLPEGGASFQHLVTGADGVARWEDRTHYFDNLPIFENITVHTVEDAEFPGVFQAQIPNVTSPDNLTDGNNVIVVFNGVSYECVYNADEYTIGNEALGFGDNSAIGEPFCIWVGDDEYPWGIVTAVEMDVTLSVYVSKRKLLDTEFLKNDVPRYGAIGELTHIEWDGNTTGLESIRYNAYSYYKVSDTVIPFDHVVKGETHRSSDDWVYSQIRKGKNCYMIGSAIMVTTAGSCSLPYGTFTAGSAGVYFEEGTWDGAPSWVAYMNIDTRRENAVLFLNNPSGKTYAITVDDSGKLVATIVDPDVESGDK